MSQEKNILVLGAGRSSSVLIADLLQHAATLNYKVHVADVAKGASANRIASHASGVAHDLDPSDPHASSKLIQQAEVVISLLPPDMHAAVAALCLVHGKSFFTASYVSDPIKGLASAFEAKGKLLLMECGLDPGIDHMSAMKELEEIRTQGGKIISFKSYTGGLIAPESDNNSWHYKITWNPRNVVLAGQGTVKYREDGEYRFIPYHQLFSRTEKISIEQHGDFEGYANRDSLKYLSVYGLDDVPTFVRGTLRKPPYCKGWNALVQLGYTDDSFTVTELADKTYEQFLRSFLPSGKEETEILLCKYLSVTPVSEEMKLIRELGLLSDEKIGIKEATPAQVLQKRMEEKWRLSPEDKDMIVMYHEIVYEKSGKKIRRIASLVVKGEDPIKTAMAKTVGLPLAIAARLYIQDKIKLKGLQIPVTGELYQPILSELESVGVKFVVRDIRY